MASSIAASFAKLTLTPLKNPVSLTSSILKSFSSVTIAGPASSVLLDHPTSSLLTSPLPIISVPNRGYKSKTYRNVKSYTFGLGQVNHAGHARRYPPRYEKDHKLRPVRSGVPFSHRVLNYENRYVNDVGYKAEYYKGGPKPRFNDEEKEHMKDYTIQNAPLDEWDEKNAVFGQNDYIDILGDGNLSIRELNVEAPFWLRGVEIKGDKFEEVQFHHTLRRLHFEEDYLLNARPTRWWQLRRELTRYARACNRYNKRGLQRWPLN